MGVLGLVVGGILGLSLTRILERLESKHRAMGIASYIFVAFVIGFLAGVFLTVDSKFGVFESVGIGLCAMLTTYCLFCTGTVRVVQSNDFRVDLPIALGQVIAGLTVAACGVFFGVLLTS